MPNCIRNNELNSNRLKHYLLNPFKQSTNDKFTWKTSSSRILVPNTVMPLVSMAAWSLRRRGLTIFFLQSTMMVTIFFSTLMATRCHLVKDTVRRGEQEKEAKWSLDASGDVT